MDTLRFHRRLGLSLGLVVLAWQLVNLGLGRFLHEYLAADVVASLVLIAASCWPGDRGPAAWMLAGFAMFAGIFLAAATGKLVVGGAHPGTIAAGLGLVPCLVGIVGLGRRLARDGSTRSRHRPRAPRRLASESSIQAISPDERDIATLRAIARAGFAYGPTKGLAEGAGWEPVDDEPDIGVLRYDIRLGADRAAARPLCIQASEGGGSPWAFVPLFDFEGGVGMGREPFDRAHEELCGRLRESLGMPSRSGTYTYPHRADWPYSYCEWRLADATLVLVQGEMDIQFGMDVTLWAMPAGGPVALPIRVE